MKAGKALHRVKRWVAEKRAKLAFRMAKQNSAAIQKKQAFEACIAHFPVEEIARLRNGARTVLKSFKADLVLRLVAFPHPEELKEYPELEGLQRTGWFDIESRLRGGIGYIKVRSLRMDSPRADVENTLKKKEIQINKPAVYVSTIQIRRPFIEDMPSRIKKRFKHFDDMLLEKFEAALQKAGVKTIVVIEGDKVPPIQRAKLFKQLLGSHGYKAVARSDEYKEIYWMKIFS